MGRLRIRRPLQSSEEEDAAAEEESFIHKDTLQLGGAINITQFTYTYTHTCVYPPILHQLALLVWQGDSLRRISYCGKKQSGGGASTDSMFVFKNVLLLLPCPLTTSLDWRHTWRRRRRRRIFVGKNCRSR